MQIPIVSLVPGRFFLPTTRPLRVIWYKSGICVAFIYLFFFLFSLGLRVKTVITVDIIATFYVLKEAVIR